MGIALVAYSLMVDVFAELFLSSHPITALSSIAEKFIFVVCAVFVIAAFIGWFGVPLRERLARSIPVLSAVPKAWDEFFGEFKTIGSHSFPRFTDGTKIGGFWASDPFASSLPCGRTSVRSGSRKIRS